MAIPNLEADFDENDQLHRRWSLLFIFNRLKKLLDTAVGGPINVYKTIGDYGFSSFASASGIDSFQKAYGWVDAATPAGVYYINFSDAVDVGETLPFMSIAIDHDGSKATPWDIDLGENWIDLDDGLAIVISDSASTIASIDPATGAIGSFFVMSRWQAVV